MENEPLFQNLNLKEELNRPSIEENKVLTMSEITEWIKPIVEYLNSGALPDDKNQAKKIQIKAA